MVFISLSGLAMGTLKQEQINAASGIYNFVRNIGGSIGIAAANTIAQRHLQTHRNQMVHWFSGASLALHRQMHMLENLMKLHAGPAKAMLRAAALLQTGLNNQAQLWAYVDVFRYLAIVCAVAVPIAFVMKKAASKAAAA
jgi:DHA2 family multidrug resistance protein